MNRIMDQNVVIIGITTITTEKIFTCSNDPLKWASLELCH